MSCAEVRERLGEYHDGELDADVRRAVEAHLSQCADCGRELAAIRALAKGIAAAEPAEVPSGLWPAIEQRLAGAQGPTTLRTLRWRPLATAAAVAIAILGGWLWSGGPGVQTAAAHEIDFAPLLNRVGSDLERGVDALLERYGGRAITLAEAEKIMTVRVHPPEELPGGLRLAAMHLLNMGGHESLALRFAGPSGQLLVMQCPPGMVKRYGGRECRPCQVGPRAGEVVSEGAWRLVHTESENVCICVVSTLDEQRELPAVLEALRVDY